MRNTESTSRSTTSLVFIGRSTTTPLKGINVCLVSWYIIMGVSRMMYYRCKQ
jgi:hypothetical protein